MKSLVISAVNFTEGGPLTVLVECLQEARRTLRPPDWKIIALVHDKSLFDLSGIEFIEFPDAKRPWIKRLATEFWHFNSLSKRLNPDVWLSLHDISPRVKAKRQAVYCHNPAPFFKANLWHLAFEPNFYLFTKLYRHLYRLNIKANDLVIVQQNWLRMEFTQLFQLQNVIVAHPLLPKLEVPPSKNPSSPYIFLFPALPRVFKNFETLCEATERLQHHTNKSFEVHLTISGLENRYARWIHRRYGHIKNLKFIGRQSRVQMERAYHNADAVVFPSRLETWGLPITEAKQWGKQLIVADLPYAHETVGDYDQVRFFEPDNPEKLRELMTHALHHGLSGCHHTVVPVPAPFAANWQELLRAVVGTAGAGVESPHETVDRNA